MFRRVFVSMPRLAKGVGGIGLAATAIAVSDAELKKKPSWYREEVHHLEHILKKLSIYSYIEDIEWLEEARNRLQRCENVNNCEISWRLGRAQTEKADLLALRDYENREQLLVKAIENFQKAFTLEPAKGVPGAHKWYAIALKRLKDVNAKHRYLKNGDKQITEHLEKAVKLDPNDAISHHLLGVHYYEKGNLDEAMKNFQAVEKLKKEYYASNIYFIGLIYHKQKKKEEALKMFKHTLAMQAMNKFDRRAKASARAMMYIQYKQKPEDVAPFPEY